MELSFLLPEKFDYSRAEEDVNKFITYRNNIFFITTPSFPWDPISKKVIYNDDWLLLNALQWKGCFVDTFRFNNDEEIQKLILQNKYKSFVFFLNFLSLDNFGSIYQNAIFNRKVIRMWIEKN